VAADLVMDRGALAHNLKPLERDGFVRQDVDPRDRRNRVISLTEEGRARLRESEMLWLAHKRNSTKRMVRSVRSPARGACSYCFDKFIANFEGAV